MRYFLITEAVPGAPWMARDSFSSSIMRQRVNISSDYLMAIKIVSLGSYLMMDMNSCCKLDEILLIRM